MRRNPLSVICLVGIGLTAGLGGLLGNIASSKIPEDWGPYLWISWPLFIIFVLAGIVLAIWREIPKPPSYIEQAKAALNSTDTATRTQAVKTLEQSNEPAARGELAKVTQHPIQDVRTEATFALARLKDERAVPPLIDLLCDDEKRGNAEHALVQLGTPSIPYLLKALGSKDEKLRAIVVGILGKIGGVEVVPDLVRVLGDNEQSVKKAALAVLKQMKNATAVPGLLGLLHDKEKNIREAVIDALGTIGDDRAIPGLLKVLHDNDPDIRVAAVGALGEIGNPDAVPGLVEVLDDKVGDSPLFRELNLYGHTRQTVYRSVHAAVARALGQIGNSAAVPCLIKALQSKTPFHVRTAAAAALGQIGDATAVPELITILMNEHEDKELRATSCEALNRINTPEARAAVAKIPSTELIEEV